MTAVVAQRARSLGRTPARRREMTHSDGRLGGGTKPEATYSKAAAEASETRPTLCTQARSVCHHFWLPPLLPPSQGLYCDIRQLVQFIKEAHGNVFRRVALSALLDSAEKVTTTKKPEEKEEGKQPGPRRYWSGDAASNRSSRSVFYHGGLVLRWWRKQDKGSTGSEKLQLCRAEHPTWTYGASGKYFHILLCFCKFIKEFKKN